MPNTNVTETMGQTQQDDLQEGYGSGKIEPRGGDYIQDPTTGKMNGSTPGNGKKTSGSASSSKKDGSDENNDSDPSGENAFEVRGFKNKQDLMNYWSNKGGHAEEYKADGILTAEQYVQRALTLIESKTSKNILGHCTKNGTVIRYDKEKSDFVKGHPKKGIYTMFKPDDGLKYYDNELRKDIDNGGWK